MQLLELIGQARFQIPFTGQAKEDVFPHRQVGEQQRLLRYQINAELMRLRWRKPCKRLPRNRKFTAVGRFNSGDDLHQRRFSRTVPAHQGVYLAREQREINAF